MSSVLRLRALRVASAGTLLIGLAAAVAANPAVTTPAKAATFLTADQAQAQAISTGQPVVATALSTETATTTANPDGSFTASESAEPVQELVNGAWTPLDATLQANSDGSFSPAVSAAPLSLSGGGNTTLATLTADNRTMTISWPATLPAPTVSGDTATYASVYPGVDLQVTADGQGGFSDVLIVHDATSAANPALASINLTIGTGGGLVLSTDATGDLIAAAGASDPPLISFDAPQIWDSTLPPATEATVVNNDGVTVDATSGQPAYSTADSPGTGAALAPVPVTLSGNTLTLSPPASVLTGASTVYPVYIDPHVHNYVSVSVPQSRWTQVFSGWPTDTRYYMRHDDLKVGLCPADLDPRCYFNGTAMGVAHSFIEMKIPTELFHPKTDIMFASLTMTEDWAASCTPEEVRLYPVGVGINRETDWSNAPAMPDTGATYASQSISFGHPGGTGCTGYLENDVTWGPSQTGGTAAVQDIVAADAASKTAYQTWGLRAGIEDPTNPSVSDLYWKQFQDVYKGQANITLSVHYNYPPEQPTDLLTDPGGHCHQSQNNPAVIGNDDVVFYSRAIDKDDDTQLTTHFTLYNQNNVVAYSSDQQQNNKTTGENTYAQWPFTRQGMQNFASTYGSTANGATTAYKYYYVTSVTDNANLNSLPSDKCWILYNPKGPSAPTVTFSPTQLALGAKVTATFSTPGCSASTNPCPVSYSYEQGADSPVTVKPTSTTSPAQWSGPITITHVGPIEFTVQSADASGNLSEPRTTPVIGTVPTTKYKDGYFSGGPYPDVLTVGTGNKPSLWLSTGFGNGAINTPVDIGSLGTAIDPGTDGRGDWKGAIVLHGDFTGHNVQDVMAYYPTGNNAGSGVVIDGTGDSFTLDPWSGSNNSVNSSLMVANDTGSPPVQLTAAGNASGLGTGTDDLIGITEDGSGNSELDLFTSSPYANGSGVPSEYAFCQMITTVAPGGKSDSWANYTIATAGNPSNTVLFALNDSTDALYESKGPFTLTVPPGSPANTTPACGDTIKQPTWTTIPTSGIWEGTPTGLIQGDINHAGTTEIWVYGGTSGITAYTVSGTTLAWEGGGYLSAVANNWPLVDGNSNLYPTDTTVTTANDNITGSNAAITGNYSWKHDSYFVTDLSLDGSTSYVTPPASTIPAGGYPSISVWFKTKRDGVIASVQGQAVSTSSSTTGGYDPVLYIGTNGLLYAEWWNSTLAPIASTYKVDDGIWHHAVLESFLAVACPPNNCVGWQRLTLDGQVVATLSGNVSGNWNNLTFGAGYVGGSWPNYPNSHAKSGSTGWLSYFNGELADISLTLRTFQFGSG